jgi:hypothetical protein
MFVTNEEKALQAVALQLMNGDEIVVSDQKLAVKRVRGERLRFVQFKTSGREIEAIEQNRKKPGARDSWLVMGIRWCSFGMWRPRSMRRGPPFQAGMWWAHSAVTGRSRFA